MATATTKNPVKPKIYHLIDNGKSSIEHYQRINKHQRVRLGVRKNDRPYLQITCTEADDVNRTLRFKLNCNSIDQSEQIEKYKIPANERFTDAERGMLQFKNGILVVTNKIAQEFLDRHPQNESFTGDCPDVTQKLFREFVPEEKTKNEVNAFRRRLDAANKVAEVSLEEGQALLMRLYGSFYKPSNDINDVIAALVAYLDEADDKGVEEVLRDGKTLQDEITILIGKALQKELLSFEESGMENFVVKKKAGKIIPLKEISATLGIQERKRLFADFLASNDGILHLDDLRKEVGSTEEKKKEKSATKDK